MAGVARAATVTGERDDDRHQAINLFLVGFLVLFLELACIRWFAAYVVFLQFSTNVVLIASFLGMSCGCMAAQQKRDWLAAFPLLGLTAVVAAVIMMYAYLFWIGVAADVGRQASIVFFGTDARNPDVAHFVVPIEAISAAFFVLVALMFVGPGQALGRAFDAYPNRVLGYTFNIGGSLAGIVGFSLLSFLQTPPVVWFAVVCAGIAWLLIRQESMTPARLAGLGALLFVVAVPAASAFRSAEVYWSPYYSVAYVPTDRDIRVNSFGHQMIVPFNEGGASYSLIHLLQRHSGGAPFGDVLVIGAGSGNDINHALRFGARRVDAVEIDPAIQSLGYRKNPDHPYQDPRIVPHLDDGRHFLRTTNRKYDLVVYALVDSLIAHSSYANLRLESYLFTPEAFDEVRHRLKPGGTFVMYNYFREGWIVQRIAAMAQKAFGCPPLVISLPYQTELRAESPAGFTMIIAGCGSPVAAAFTQHPTFWLNTSPPKNLTVDGFNVRPQTLSPSERGQYQQISPTHLVGDGRQVQFTSDDWPFLYLHSHLIPGYAVRLIIVLGALGIGMVGLFLPRGRLGAEGRMLFLPRGRLGAEGRMFFLGAAFMLLETRAVVQMALLFGNTWLVNSAVFFTVLVLILLANLFVLRARSVNLNWCYAGLFALLAAGAFVPADSFLNGGMAWRYVAPCLLALGPMLFAGVIFAQTFKHAPNPDLAFGSNVAGSVVGGLAESFSMLLGFEHLLLVAMALYAFSMWAPRMRETGSAIAAYPGA
jgi:SAM-dependent methyltransferase